METLIIIILVFTFLSIWRRSHNKYEAAKYRYNLFRLRDELRWLAIKGKIDKDSWIFNYYDESLSKNISNHYYITLFTLFTLSAKHSRTNEISEKENLVKTEIEKIPKLKEINDQFISATFNYIIAQHKISWVLFIMPFFKVFYGIDFIVQKIKRWSAKLMFYPETSDTHKLKPI